MSSRKTGILFFLIVCAFVMGVAYWKQVPANKGNPGDTAEKQTIRMTVAKALITAPVLLALEKGYFEDEGLNVIVTGQSSSGKESFESMLAGRADFSTPATTPVVANSFQSDGYSIFVTYLTTYDGVKVIARSDSGIKTPADLAGKRIGIVKGTISQILLDTLLTYNKIFISDVEMKAYRGLELPEALLRGDVDAISVWEPYANRALNLMPGIAVQIPSQRVYRIAINMAVMNTFASENPDSLVKIIAALKRATNFLNQEPEASQSILSEILEMDKTLIADLWKDMNFEISLDQLLLLTMENEARWMIGYHTLSEADIPNYLGFINYSALMQFDTDAVTIIGINQ